MARDYSTVGKEFALHVADPIFSIPYDLLRLAGLGPRR